MAITKKASSRVALLCLWLLVLVCGQANAEFMDNVRGIVKGVVSTAKNVANDVTYTAEGVVDKDINNDGQIGKFRPQTGNEDVRQVSKDENGVSRFQLTRQRTGRSLTTEEENTAPSPRLRK